MELPMRKPNRLKDYDYAQNGAYFITICTRNRECLYGEIFENGNMMLNENGIIVNDEMVAVSTHYQNIVIDTFVIMPNHIHLIIFVGAPLAAPDNSTPEPNNAGRASTPPTVGNIIRGYKSGVSRKIGFSVWQRNYHDHIIRNEADYNRITDYIENNPANWANDCFYGGHDANVQHHFK